MVVFPQLSQFPVKKRRRPRTVINETPDGSSVRLTDPAGEITEWVLSYSELSDAELQTLQEFFATSEGRLNGFAFLDPTANLLAWSEELTNAVWQTGPWLSAVKGSGFWTLVNRGGGAQEITQTITGPGDYLYCLSAYVRATQPVDVTLRIAGQSAVRRATPEWTRIVFSANGDSGAESVLFGLGVPAGGSVDMSGIQAEPQAGASTYKSSTRGGVYEDARLGEDYLAVTTTGPNQHSCTVKITHANHF